MAVFRRALAGVSLLLGLGQPACITGGQTGQDSAYRGPCLTVEADPAALLDKYAGTYRAPAVRSTSDDRCPSDGYPTLEVTVTGAVSEEELADMPCGARFIAVSVEVTTDDGEPSLRFDGWLDEDGRVIGEQYSLTLSPDSNEVLTLNGFGSLRIVEACCLEPPPEEVASGVELGSTGAQRFEFFDEATEETRTTELSLSLTTSSAAEACGTLAASFELHTEAGKLAARGDGSMEFRSTSCDGGDPPCLKFSYTGAGSVTDQALFLGYANFPEDLGPLDLTFQGTARDGRLETGFWTIEVAPLVMWTGTIPP